MPDFSIPEGEAEYKGDPANKKDQTSHRKHLAQLELQTQLKKVCPQTFPRKGGAQLLQTSCVGRRDELISANKCCVLHCLCVLFL